MLKLIYTETALHLELIATDIEGWVRQRQIFAKSIAETILISAEKATFLLPDLVCEATAANFYLYRQGVQTVTVNSCDRDQVEIELTGYWLCSNANSAEGIFVTQLPDRVESYLWQLWSNANSLPVAPDLFLT
jgi:hypothetical protein